MSGLMNERRPGPIAKKFSGPFLEGWLNVFLKVFSSLGGCTIRRTCKLPWSGVFVEMCFVPTRIES